MTIKADELIVNADFKEDVKAYERSEVTVRELADKYETSRQTMYDIFHRLAPNPTIRREEIREESNREIGRLLDEGVPVEEVLEQYGNLYKSVSYINRLIRKGDIPVTKYKTRNEIKVEQNKQMVDDFESRLETLAKENDELTEDELIEKYKEDFPTSDDADHYDIHQDVYRNRLKKHYDVSLYDDAIRKCLSKHLSK